jgi:drug/metabolite transporter (DMT)-like permease
VLRALSFNSGDLIIISSQSAWIAYTLYSRANTCPLGPATIQAGALWYYQGVRAIGAGRAAVVMNLIPFLVIGLSWALLGESIRWYHGVGACVVIAGVALATRR